MLNRLLAPFRSTTGLARWILVTGIVITIAFVVMAVFAPWIAPLDFNQQKVDGVKLPKLAHPATTTGSAPATSSTTSSPG